MDLDKEFAKLGYKTKQTNEWNIKYVKYLGKNQFYQECIVIDFRIHGDNEFYKYDRTLKAVPITNEERKLINKKAEELGWDE